MTKMSGKLQFTTVDEAIECLPIANATQGALLTAMPNAYKVVKGHEAHEYPPEPDCPCRVLRGVARVWWTLAEDVRKDLNEAVEAM